MEVATASLFCTFFESLDAPTIFRTHSRTKSCIGLVWRCLAADDCRAYQRCLRCAMREGARNNKNPAGMRIDSRRTCWMVHWPRHAAGTEEPPD